MTTKEKLKEMLTQRGLSEQQSEDILQIGIPQIEAEIELQNPDYQITWNGKAIDYPEVMYGIWFSMLKPIALKWLETNKPAAWFLPMFKD